MRRIGLLTFVLALAVLVSVSLAHVSAQPLYPPGTLPAFGNIQLPLTDPPEDVSLVPPLTPPDGGGTQDLAVIPSAHSGFRFNAQTPAPGAIDFQACNATADKPPQAIVDLAAALKNDPNLIFHYVHDNIDLDIGVESSKGALGTYLDQSGNSFDQSALLLALLQSAAAAKGQTSSAQIVIGLAPVTAAQFGLSSLPASLLVNAGDYSSWAGQGLIPYAWVKVNINGFTVVMDPAAKTYSSLTGGNLSSYQPNQPGSSATSINNYLTGFASRIYTSPSQQNYAPLVDLIGGRRINVSPTSTNYNPNNRGLGTPASNPNGVTPATSPVAYNRMPYFYRTILQVTLAGYGGSGQPAVCLDQMYGHDVLMYYTNFDIDNVTVFAGNGSGAISSDTFKVVHQTWTQAGQNTTNWQQSVTEPFTNTAGAAISVSVGHVGGFRAQEAARVAELAEAPGALNSVLKLFSIGGSQLRQTSRGTELLDQLAGTFTNNHHTVQFVHYVLGSNPVISLLGTTTYAGVDTPMTATSVDTVSSSPPSGLTVTPNAVAYALSTLQSAQEAAALNQANVPGSVSAATLMGLPSTSNLVSVANGADLDANTKTHYSAAQIATIEAYSGYNPHGPGFDLAVPSYPSTWGAGTNALAFLATAPNGTSAFVLQTPDGQVYKGASSASVIGADGGTVGIGGAQPESGPRGPGLSINPGSGTVAFAAPMLSIGGAGSPYSLAFSVAYSSSASNQLSFGTGNAPGWSHNYQMSLAKSTDAAALIGSDLTGPAIPGIVSLYHLLQDGNAMAGYYSGGGVGGANYLNTAYDAAVTAAWYLKAAVNDTVAISRGTATEPFALMPDGTYHTLSPSGEQLAVNGSNFVWIGPHGDKETFPAAGGAITQATTANAVATTFSYTPYGSKSLLSQVSTAAHFLKFVYQSDPVGADADYLLSKVTDDSGRSVSFGYCGDAVGSCNFPDLTLITLVDGATLSPGYTAVTSGDFWGPVAATVPLLTSMADPLTHTTSLSYDSRVDATQMTDANSNTTHYLTAGNRVEVDDAAGNASYQVTYPVYGYGDWVVTDRYDALGYKTQTLSYYNGQLFKKTLPNTQPYYDTYYTYDGNGNLTSTAIGPTAGNLQILSQTQWDQTWNKPHLVTDPKGNTTEYDYYPNGNLQYVKQPVVYELIPNGASGNFQPVTSYTYWSSGQVKTVTDASNDVTCYNYDTNSTWNLLSVVVDCSTDSGHLNLTTTLRYSTDNVGNVASVTTPNLNTTTATYDGARRLKTKTNPPLAWFSNKSLVTTYTYYADGRLQQSSFDTGTAAVGGDAEIYQVANQTYDNVGNLKTKTVPTTGSGTLTTQYQYDVDERLWITTDPAGHTTTQTYDADSRPFQTEDGSGNLVKSVYYTWDGLTDHVVDGNGNSTQYTYDAYDRLTKTTYGDGTYELLTLDKDGGVSNRLDRSGNSFAITLDALERETAETDTPSAQGQSTYTKSMQYSPISQVLTLNGTDGNFTYTFDRAGRQTQTSSAGIPGIGEGAYTNNYTYDADGDTQTITYPDGYTYTYGYDSLDEMQTVDETAPDLTNTHLVTYALNTLGSVTNAAFGNGASTGYTAYDQYNHVTEIQHTLTNSALTIDYALDSDERRMQDSFSNNAFVWHPPAAATVGYAMKQNNLNQYDTIGNSASLTYSPNGTLTGDPTAPLGNAIYGWDMFNRLTTVQNNQHVASYRYDTMGRRSQKTVDGGVVNFASEGSRVIMQYGSTALPGSTQIHYVYGMGNAPFMQENFSGGVVSNRLYLHTDALGTTLALSGKTGGLNSSYPTSPWGENANTGGTPFRFAGMYYDTESMLYYDHARYYSPAQGRFISPDPIGMAGGMDIYAYVENDPVNGVDLTGLVDGTLCTDDDCTTGSNNGNQSSSSRVGTFVPKPTPDITVSDPNYYLRQSDPSNALNGANGTNLPPELAMGDGGFGIFVQFIGAILTGGASVEAEAVAEGGVRGLSVLGGIVSSEGVNAAGGELITAQGAIEQEDIFPFVQNGVMQGEVNILTGVHGYADGTTLAAPNFLAQDIREFGGLPGVNIYNFSEMLPSQITALLRGPGTTIGAFCDSCAVLRGLK